MNELKVFTIAWDPESKKVIFSGNMSVEEARELIHQVIIDAAKKVAIEESKKDASNV